MQVRTYYLLVLIAIILVSGIVIYFHRDLNVQDYQGDMVSTNQEQRTLHEEKNKENEDVHPQDTAIKIKKTETPSEAEKKPDPVTLAIEKSNEYLAKRRYDLAIRALKDVEKTHKDNPGLLAARCRISMEQGKLDEAMIFANKSLKINRTKPVSYVNRGDIYFARNEYKKALSDYNAALKLDPKSPIALTGLIRTNKKMKKYDEAIKYAEKLVQYSGDSPETRILLGQLYGKKRQNKKMLKNYLAGMEKNPDDPVSTLGAGEGLLQLNRFKEGNEYIDKAEGLMKKNPEILKRQKVDQEQFTAEILSHRADAAYMMGDYKEAVECCDKALELGYKEDPLIYYSRGAASYFLGRTGQARKDMEKYLESNPPLQGVEDYDDHGWAYLILGKRKESMEHFNKSLKMDPMWGNALLGRGMLYLEMKDYDKAKADLEKCLDAPDVYPKKKEFARKKLRVISNQAVSMLLWPSSEYVWKNKVR